MLLDMALRHHWHSQFFCSDKEKAISGYHRLLAGVPAVPEGLTPHGTPTPQGWEANVRILLNNCTDTVRSCEGGGPEVLLESLVLTFSRLQALAAASSSPRDTHEVGLKAE